MHKNVSRKTPKESDKVGNVGVSERIILSCMVEGIERECVYWMHLAQDTLMNKNVNLWVRKQ
jgi:hypothetical protein